MYFLCYHFTHKSRRRIKFSHTMRGLEDARVASFVVPSSTHSDSDCVENNRLLSAELKCTSIQHRLASELTSSTAIRTEIKIYKFKKPIIVLIIVFQRRLAKVIISACSVYLYNRAVMEC